MPMDSKSPKLNSERILFFNFDKRFNEHIINLYKEIADFVPSQEHYGIIAMGESRTYRLPHTISGDVVFFSYEKPFPKELQCKSVIDCGMNKKCSLTLSSVGTEEAMLCINRDILYNGIRIEQSEKSLSLVPKLSLYDNIVIGGIDSITKKHL